METSCFARISIVTKDRDGALVVVAGSKYGENIHFSMVFHRFGHAPTDSKNECFPGFWMETSCFARMSIVTKNMVGAVVVVAGSKYGENIHFSKVFHKFGHAPTDPKNGCFPVIWLEIQCFARLFPLIEW